ncbi:MAG: hypothetical protein GTO63_21455 [Anaerolineae bacterium]|nr:hypothetical protein [Anaerolineae bacterium]NIQ80273.1 hypothetical protein [Anaerolineae bacterium]
MRECSECGADFDPRAPAKRRAGGLITHCADCSEETAVRVVGLTAGDGKQAAISIVALDTEQDRRAFLSYWQRASGLHRGKSCQMHQPGMTAPAVRFRTVATDSARNHKGKA